MAQVLWEAGFSFRGSKIQERSRWVGRGRNVQESQAEDADEEVFLLLPELQLAQHGQRHDEDGEVGGDVSGGVDVPEGQVGHTRARPVCVPEFVDRRAGEDDDEELRHCPHHDDGPEDPYHLLHLVYRQHSIVLEQEREFDKGEGDIVKDDGQPKVLPLLVSDYDPRPVR